MSDNPLLDLPVSVPGVGDAPLSPAVAIGALAMNFALKYHDIATIKDGVYYQQRKMEGVNFVELHLDVILDTAKRIEQHLIGSSERIATTIIDMLGEGVAEDALADIKDIVGDKEPEPE